jgi:hypothetical protein
MKNVPIGNEKFTKLELKMSQLGMKNVPISSVTI